MRFFIWLELSTKFHFPHHFAASWDWKIHLFPLCVTLVGFIRIFSIHINIDNDSGDFVGFRHETLFHFLRGINTSSKKNDKIDKIMILYLCGCCRLLLLLRLPSILFGFVFRRYVCMWFIAVARIWIMPHVPNAHNPNVQKQNHHHKYTKYKCASFIQKIFEKFYYLRKV